MKKVNWLNEAARVLYSSVWAHPGKKWLCVHEHHLVLQSHASICKASLKIMEFSSYELSKGLSTRRWDLVASKLRLLAEEGVL